MYKSILNEEAVYYDFINCPKGFEINREKIKHGIMYGYINNKHVQNKQYPVEHRLHLDYLNSYITDFVKLKENFKLEIFLKEKFSYILNHNEKIERKNHFDSFNIQNSPTYVLIYGIELEEKSSNLIIHHSYKKTPNSTRTIPMQNNKFIMFPAHLDYEITNNTSKLNGFYLVNLYHEASCS